MFPSCQSRHVTWQVTKHPAHTDLNKKGNYCPMQMNCSEVFFLAPRQAGWFSRPPLDLTSLVHRSQDAMKTKQDPDSGICAPLRTHGDPAGHGWLEITAVVSSRFRTQVVVLGLLPFHLNMALCCGSPLSPLL